MMTKNELAKQGGSLGKKSASLKKKMADRIELFGELADHIDALEKLLGEAIAMIPDATASSKKARAATNGHATKAKEAAPAMAGSEA